MTLGRDKRFAPRSRILHGIGLFALPLPIIFLIILAATPLSGQATEPAAQGDGATLEKWIPRAVLEADFPVSAEEMLGHVHFLAHDRLRGRDAGSREEELAATYIAAELRKLGLEPAGDDGGWEQAFGLIRVVRAEGGPRVEKLTSRNVLAWLPGSDESLAGEYIVFGAHFDHLGADGEGQIYNGADDNASGVAGMLAVARACARGAIRPRRSILFVAFGAEERGLGGSRHLVSHPPRPLERLAAMINLDMIGRKSFLDRAPLRMAKAYVGIRPGPGVGLLGGEGSRQLLWTARAACMADELPSYAPTDFPLIKKQIEAMTEGRDDSAPFRERGIPAVFFSTAENDDYHRPTDTIDKIDAIVMRRIARAAWRTLLAVDALDDRAVLRGRKGRE